MANRHDAWVLLSPALPSSAAPGGRAAGRCASGAPCAGTGGPQSEDGGLGPPWPSQSPGLMCEEHGFLRLSKLGASSRQAECRGQLPLVRPVGKWPWRYSVALPPSVIATLTRMPDSPDSPRCTPKRNLPVPASPRCAHFSESSIMWVVSAGRDARSPRGPP